MQYIILRVMVSLRIVRCQENPAFLYQGPRRIHSPSLLRTTSTPASFPPPKSTGQVAFDPTSYTLSAGKRLQVGIQTRISLIDLPYSLYQASSSEVNQLRIFSQRRTLIYDWMRLLLAKPPCEAGTESPRQCGWSRYVRFPPGLRCCEQA